AAAIGFPDAGEEVPVKVDFRSQDGREIWTRTFGGRSFTSLQDQGHGRDDWLLCEYFGPLKVAMALVVEGGRLRLVARRGSVFGIPMPGALAPRSDSYE